MKKSVLLLCCLVLLPLWGMAQEKMTLSHGPYLQEVTPNGATFVFLTSLNSFSSIELRKQGAGKSALYYHSKDGFRNANTTFHSIRVEALEPGTKYEYRIRSKEIRSFQPYQVTFGDSITSQWYTFQSVDPAAKGGSFFITSDIHNDSKKLETLLKLCDYQTCTAFFYAGDVMNYMDSGETPFRAFIDMSVNLFATSIPFEVVRGNHETRGAMARSYPHLFPKKDGKIYGSYLLGDVMVIMIDGGEDKPDTHPVYANLVDFDSYRTEQARWLEQLVKTREFKKATYRIVVSHFPMAGDDEGEYGMQDLARKLLPILNKAKIDLMVSGHTHEFAYHEPNAAKNQFPVLVGSSESALRLDMAKGEMSLKVIDSRGKVLLAKKIKKQ